MQNTVKTPILESLRLARNSEPTAQADPVKINPEFKTRKELNSIIDELKARASQPTALARPAAPVAKMQAPSARAVTATATTKPTSAPQASGLTTAAQFATAPLIMQRDEFEKLNHADRGRWISSGGKLV